MWPTFLIVRTFQGDVGDVSEDLFFEEHTTLVKQIILPLIRGVCTQKMRLRNIAAFTKTWP